MWVLLAGALSLASCGPPRGSMMSYAGVRTTWRAAFDLDDHVLIVRAWNPQGMSLVVWPPRIERGDVVLNAGMASAGGGHESTYCFQIESPELPTDWRERFYWREPDGTRVHIEDIPQGDGSRGARARCRSIEPVRP